MLDFPRYKHCFELGWKIRSPLRDVKIPYCQNQHHSAQNHSRNQNHKQKPLHSNQFHQQLKSQNISNRSNQNLQWFADISIRHKIHQNRIFLTKNEQQRSEKENHLRFVRSQRSWRGKRELSDQNPRARRGVSPVRALSSNVLLEQFKLCYFQSGCV